MIARTAATDTPTRQIAATSTRRLDGARRPGGPGTTEPSPATASALATGSGLSSALPVPTAEPARPGVVAGSGSAGVPGAVDGWLPPVPGVVRAPGDVGPDGDLGPDGEPGPAAGVTVIVAAPAPPAPSRHAGTSETLARPARNDTDTWWSAGTEPRSAH